MAIEKYQKVTELVGLSVCKIQLLKKQTRNCKYSKYKDAQLSYRLEIFFFQNELTKAYSVIPDEEDWEEIGRIKSFARHVGIKSCSFLPNPALFGTTERGLRLVFRNDIKGKRIIVHRTAKHLVFYFSWIICHHNNLLTDINKQMNSMALVAVHMAA
jgi:hypothetical protein